MLRASVLVFMAGWVAWFLVDKNGLPAPRMTESLVDNLQFGFDMLRAGYPVEAFVYLWREHFVVLSLIGGLLVSLLYGAGRDMLGRRRLRNLMYPVRDRTRGSKSEGAAGATPGQPAAPAPRDDING